jgi:hypothetical protein
MNKQQQLRRIRFYKDLKITRQIRDIIHGYIMSDGYVTNTGNLTVDQTIKQAKFVEWLFQKFETIRTDSPIRNVRRVDKRNNTVTFSARFNTRNLLHGFHSMWYKPSLSFYEEEQNKMAGLPSDSATPANLQPITYKKSLPKSIHCFFSPAFITIWFAGDGTKIIGSKGAKFEVTNFSPQDRQTLKILFKQKYNISACINRAGFSKTGAQQWTISINAGDYDKFKRLITQIDLIPTLFPHKLH